jgi:hypothetical protein
MTRSKTALPLFSGAAAPSALDAYLQTHRVDDRLRRFIVCTRVLNTQLKTPKDYEKYSPTLILYTISLQSQLPEICELCEGMAERHKKAYRQLADLVGIALRWQAHGVCLQFQEERKIFRFQNAYRTLLNLLSQQEPRRRDETRLAPLHIQESSYLESVLAGSLSPIAQIVFLKMREQMMGDHLDYFVSMMAHCLSSNTRYTARLKHEIPAVFSDVYDLMTPEEKMAVTKCRNATACPESIAIIDELLLGKVKVDMLQANRRNTDIHRGQTTQVRAL